MMHITVKHIADENCHTGPIFALSTELRIFFDRLAASLRNDVAILFNEFSYMSEIWRGDAQYHEADFPW